MNIPLFVALAPVPIAVTLVKVGEELVVDGIPGSKTVEAWAFRSTGWEAMNQRRRTK